MLTINKMYAICGINFLQAPFTIDSMLAMIANNRQEKAAHPRNVVYALFFSNNT
jgi:hypothetical protein